MAAVAALAWGGSASAVKPVPSFSKVKQAIQSTGATLCDLTEAGNTSERIFGQTTTGSCATEVPHEALVHICTNPTKGLAKQTAKIFTGISDYVWLNQTIVVADDNPAAGTNSALKKLGFKRV